MSYDADSGAYTFKPDENFNGSTQISYTIEDADGNQLPVSKFIEVQAVNDRPRFNSVEPQLQQMEPLPMPAAMTRSSAEL